MRIKALHTKHLAQCRVHSKSSGNLSNCCHIMTVINVAVLIDAILITSLLSLSAQHQGGAW